MTTQKRSIVGKKTAKLKAKKLDSALAIRLQNLATSIFITGFTGAIVATRLLGATSGANVKHRPLTSDLGVASQTFVADSSSTTNAEMQLQKTRSRLLHTQKLLNELVQQIRNTPTSAGPQRENALKRARTIARNLQVFERLSNVPARRYADGVILEMCAAPEESAVIFLSTGNTYLAAGGGAITLSLAGNHGEHQFTFASGTTQANIINAFNSFTNQTGVEASQSIENNKRIQINAVEVGPDGLVYMREIDGPAGKDFIFEQAIGGIALDDLKDFGKNAITLQAIKNDP